MSSSHLEPPLYDQIGAAYAAVVDHATTTRTTSRPAMLALLPPVQGCDVLDAGCGLWMVQRATPRSGARG